MKARNFLLFFILLLSVSCKKDKQDDNVGPIICPPLGVSKLFEYSNTNVADFKMYVGSPEGAVDITDSIANPITLIQSIFDRYEEFSRPDTIFIYSYDSLMFIFNKIDSDKFDIYDYKWNNDTLVTTHSVKTRFLGVGKRNSVGKMDSLIHKVGFYKANVHKLDQELPVAFRGSDWNRDIFNLDYFKNNYRIDLKYFTEPTDTLFWVNVNYIYTIN